MVIGVLSTFALLAAVVQVEGTTSCPSPTLVAARLEDLLPSEAASQQTDRALLWEEGDDLVVRLEQADGRLLGTRRLPRAFGCPDLASAVAVSVAGWESDIHPEFSATLAARAQLPTPTSPLAVSPPPARQPWNLHAGLALEFGGSVDAFAAAGGATIGAWLTPPGWRGSLRAEIDGQSRRQLPVEGGDATWRRWVLGLGVERAFFANTDGTDGWLRWLAMARLALLDLQGQGFSLNHRDQTLDAGAALGLRVVTARKRWSSWIELAVSAWPVRHELFVVGIADRTSLPTIEAFLRLGVLSPVR